METQKGRRTWRSPLIMILMVLSATGCSEDPYPIDQAKIVRSASEVRNACAGGPSRRCDKFRAKFIQTAALLQGKIISNWLCKVFSINAVALNSDEYLFRCEDGFLFDLMGPTNSERIYPKDVVGVSGYIHGIGLVKDANAVPMVSILNANIRIVQKGS